VIDIDPLFSEHQLVLGQLVAAVALCSDLEDACSCLESILRQLIDFEHVVLFVREPLTEQISCYSRVGFLGTINRSDEQAHEPYTLISQATAATLPEMRLNAGEIGRNYLNFDANSCILLPLTGMRSESGMLGLFFLDAGICRNQSIPFLQCIATAAGQALEHVVQHERFARLDASLQKANTRLDTLRAIAHGMTQNQNL
jgi:transcriptional regulator with GAF, ATPase, and Fis domain